MSSSVFVSHSTRDKLQVEGRILTALQGAGVSRWYAPDSIRGGAEWPAAIDRAIVDSDLVVLVVSKAAAKSKWVHTEISLALHMKRPIIPVRLDATDVGAVHKGISQIQHIEAPADRSAEALAQELTTAIKQQLGEAKPTTRAALSRREQFGIWVDHYLNPLLFALTAGLLVLLVVRHMAPLYGGMWTGFGALVVWMLATFFTFREVRARRSTRSFFAWLRPRGMRWAMAAVLLLLIVLNLTVASVHIHYVHSADATAPSGYDVQAMDGTGRIIDRYRVDSIDERDGSIFWPLFSPPPGDGDLQLALDQEIPYRTRVVGFGPGSRKVVEVPRDFEMQFHALHVVAGPALFGRLQDRPATSAYEIRIEGAEGEILLPWTRFGRMGALLIGGEDQQLDALRARPDQIAYVQAKTEEFLQGLTVMPHEEDLLKRGWQADPQRHQTNRPLRVGDALTVRVSKRTGDGLESEDFLRIPGIRLIRAQGFQFLVLE